MLTPKTCHCSWCYYCKALAKSNHCAIWFDKTKRQSIAIQVTAFVLQSVNSLQITMSWRISKQLPGNILRTADSEYHCASEYSLLLSTISSSKIYAVQTIIQNHIAATGLLLLIRLLHMPPWQLGAGHFRTALKLLQC